MKTDASINEGTQCLFLRFLNQQPLWLWIESLGIFSTFRVLNHIRKCIVRKYFLKRVWCCELFHCYFLLITFCELLLTERFLRNWRVAQRFLTLKFFGFNALLPKFDSNTSFKPKNFGRKSCSSFYAKVSEININAKFRSEIHAKEDSFLWNCHSIGEKIALILLFCENQNFTDWNNYGSVAACTRSLASTGVSKRNKNESKFHYLGRRIWEYFIIFRKKRFRVSMYSNIAEISPTVLLWNCQSSDISFWPKTMLKNSWGRILEPLSWSILMWCSERKWSFCISFTLPLTIALFCNTTSNIILHHIKNMETKSSSQMGVFFLPDVRYLRSRQHRQSPHVWTWFFFTKL